MTIAELLVETARIYISTGWRTQETALDTARKLVEQVYGPPCDEAVNYCNGKYLPMPEPASLSAECDRCGWPRSMHGETQPADDPARVKLALRVLEMLALDVLPQEITRQWCASKSKQTFAEYYRNELLRRAKEQT